MAAKKKAKKKKSPAKKKTKPAAKKKAKPAAKKKTKPAVAPKPTPAPAYALDDVGSEFPAEVEAFCNRVNEGDAGDLEGYASFNEQYKPADWARNPALDKLMLTFAMDGAGGQFTLWRQPGRALLDNPVVQLGDDGELHVLAVDFASFCALVASGVDLFTRGTEDLQPHAGVQAFVSETWPGRTFGDAKSILEAAAAAHPGFEEWMRAQVKN